MEFSNFIYPDYKNDTFDHQIWPTDTYTNPKLLQIYLNSLNLVGKKITNLKFVGYCFNYSEHIVEEEVYCQLINHGYSEEDAQKKSNYLNIKEDCAIAFPRFAELDEPILIEIDNEYAIEFGCPFEGEYRVGVNSIPWWINAGITGVNCKAKELFKPFLDKSITSVLVKTENQSTYISSIDIVVDNGYILRIKGWMDFSHIFAYDENEKLLDMNYKEFKRTVLNYSDLHYDLISKYRTESSMLYFGREGANYIENPYLSLNVSGSNSYMHIKDDDFFFLGWAIALYKNEWFDENENYKFDYNEWFQVLEKAEYLLSFKDFDELFDFGTSQNITFGYDNSNFFLTQFNCYGERYWNSKEDFILQINEIKVWSSIVLTNKTTMNVFGY